ncbi:phosphate/phosphite/phosphonate ABC transporter substrate-binding protein [Parvibaculum sp.]|jgi:phosphonate transport system substrate-binding protein|uniref:phosphate/phosphite/phosphonate ABC transporter substrate-binding protein n=1 Tax=Parvibaculum sp. TaxID=2024848 RepID=UPI001B0C3808|nr:phosphate/phosphite/phosphonate ABC transporter substrate-binding protein [Parvibaculum sp.]MBO6635387.1 phosphate/phosphite/phosphonate ABC transporter substrate-binding protein [Parvibaculum sp.]MBO6679185.1 phosphate/phosphite/phosphonate ABC transporter substrate-binding protein [Parvibaculum sp.]MBO6685696.1 phosphate/phosphite/phosphonate ABC transporter substrate-binding protein [Parvibaculum sp.]MBO6906021.1 phosphate/phosphite/phosphonate ABC transporter substrate-binding protein [P
MTFSLNRRTLIASVFAAATVFSPFAAQAQEPNPDTLRVALLPDENAATLIQNAQPLKEYLSKTLDKNVEIVVTTDYSSMIEAMRFGRIEIGYFGPFSYVLAKSKAPEIEAFAVGVDKGKPTYNSVLIATADGPVKSIADIKGKSFGFGDQASTSSHLAPRAHLVKNGLVGGTDYEAVHLGTHDAVARAVQAGQIPAGALSEPILRTLIERGTIDASKIVELDLTAPIPNYPIAMQGYLAPELKEKIRSAFLDLKDEEILASFRAEGFQPADDTSYDVLRETAQLLNLELAQMN